MSSRKMKQEIVEELKAELYNIIEEALNEESGEISLPDGVWKVTKEFKLSPGSWRASFKKDEILKFNKRTQQLKKYKGKGQWKLITPPIRGKETFDISQYGRLPEQQAMLSAFNNNTISLGKDERAAKGSLIKYDEEMTDVITVAQIEDFIKSHRLKRTDRIKIEIL